MNDPEPKDVWQGLKCAWQDYKPSDQALTADVAGVQDFIKQFTNFSTENVFAVLKQLVGFIQNSDIKLFNEPLPLVNQSIKDVLAFANNIVDGLNGSTDAIKNLKSVFFNGGKTSKDLLVGVAAATCTRRSAGST